LFPVWSFACGKTPEVNPRSGFTTEPRKARFFAEQKMRPTIFYLLFIFFILSPNPVSSMAGSAPPYGGIALPAPAVLPATTGRNSRMKTRDVFAPAGASTTGGEHKKR
jgi:hypothetical protein